MINFAPYNIKYRMIEVLFADEALEELYETDKTKDRKYKSICRKPKLVEAYIKVVNKMKASNNVSDLSMYSSLHYEKLKYEYSGTSSVRLISSNVERLKVASK